jgi:CHAT domain-containing protein
VTNALSSARRAAHLARSIRSKKTQWDAYCIEGDVLQTAGRIREAALAYGKAVRAIEELRANVSNWDVDQQTFFESRLKPYQEMVRMQLGKGRFSSALAYAEMAKARSLLDLMRRRRGAGTLAQPLSGGPELTETSTGARGKWLDRRTVVIEYLVMKDKTLAFVLSGKGGHEPEMHTFTVNVAKAALLEKSRLFRQALEEHRPNFSDAARELYDSLLKPAAAQLEGRDTICFIPDSGLWDLPFQALISSDGRFLLEQHAVFYAPSIAGLRALNERAARTSRSVPPTLLAMGNPTPSETSIVSQESSYRGLTLGALPEAETEVRSIAQEYGAKALVLVGQAANEETLKREASRYRILHFATHGVLDNLNPMRSYLLLSPGQGSDIDDGRLDAQEMMNLNLDVDLTVLAACQTGRGKVRNGEGLLGMSWALFAAGCPSTIASQWKVDSASTMKLMIHLHQNLQSGMSKARALQGAAQEVKGSSLYRHPHYWAPFILIGANSARAVPANLLFKTKGGEPNESPNEVESRIEPAGRGSTTLIRNVK